ncbi:hypothetical protein Droror1_Dr00014079 [Drosera rotundifolia]
MIHNPSPFDMKKSIPYTEQREGDQGKKFLWRNHFSSAKHEEVVPTGVGKDSKSASDRLKHEFRVYIASNEDTIDPRFSLVETWQGGNDEIAEKQTTAKRLVCLSGDENVGARRSSIGFNGFVRV